MQNYRKIDTNTYLVRTQAGFKQAIRQYKEETENEGQLSIYSKYPKSYPSVVCLTSNTEFMKIYARRVEHIDAYKSRLMSILEDIDED